ncbi:family A G protein-coupled receptor-like protein [Aspergillus ellipticus CBS 707.79]|uniref:Family A G protein-coupled receptor-like protein n=1 Tax=Aspergillus ellipticus CBS 707.79 TaxID=1448320 RepID=A0A319DTQ8_9EURO|nr:family A G protein-coupled receptor-like protein [Aspergillus ellipticus CBS 707.79]
MLSLAIQSLLGAEMHPSMALHARSSVEDEGQAVMSPLPELQTKGLIVISALATLSLVCTVSLLVFFTYRFIFWKKYYKRYIGYNQYVVLMFNLVLADTIQGLGFIISLRWIATNSLRASDPACFLQGIWLQIGDPMSGLFVLAIAAHTFLHVSMGYQIQHNHFVAVVVGLWVFGVVMTIIPIAAHGQYVWYPAVAWCWMTPKYETMRLWTHYFWIFASEFFTVVLYAIMFIQLRKRIAESSILGEHNAESLHRLKRVIFHMAVYPVVYISLTLPLAAGRMASAGGNSPSVLYFCFAGSFMALCGFCDSLMYTLSRRSVVLEPEARINNSSQKTSRRNKTSATHQYGGSLDGKGPTSTTIARGRSDSTEEMIGKNGVEMAPMGVVLQHTTIEVTHERAYDSASSNLSAGRETRNSMYH